MKNIRLRIYSYFRHKIFRVPEGEYGPRILKRIFYLLFPLHWFYERQSFVKYDPLTHIFIINGMRFSGSFFDTLRSQKYIGEGFQLMYSNGKTCTLRRLSGLGESVNIIIEERRRQIDEEGFTPEVDDTRTEGELALAAACYCIADDARKQYKDQTPPSFWPWHQMWWKPTPDDRIRELTKAGALIVAEMDRLIRSANTVKE